MKILIVSQYYFPEQFLINDISEELVRRGNEVTVLTGLPNYPSGKVYPGYEDFNDDYENINGVKVIRCKIRPRKHGLINLLLNYASFKQKASKRIITLPDDYDVVFSYQLSPLTQVIPALEYKKKYGKKLLIYCLDVYPESGSVYTKKIPFAYQMVKQMSATVYNSADVVAVSSKPFIEYLNKTARVPISKMCYIPQHSDRSLLDMDLTTEDNGIVDFLFAGNVGRGPRLETIVKAAALLKDLYDFRVHIVGDGSYMSTLKQIVQEYKVNEKFIFHGYKKRTDMPKYFKMADVLYISLRKGNVTLPGKFQTYLSTGKPIIGSIDGAACEIIDEIGCGQYAPAENFRQLAKIMQGYINGIYTKPEPQIMKDYFNQHFAFQIVMDELCDLLKGLL